MGMSFAYGPVDGDEVVATLQRARELGVTFLDTADVYGFGANEELVGKAIAGYRDEVVLATKFGIVEPRRPAQRRRPPRVRPLGMRRVARTASASITSTSTTCHRPDTTVPIEDTVGAMGELVAAGKVRHLGLSEASADTVRRAAAVHPIAALQSEWSLFTRDLEAEIVPACRELGIGLVPYSPLGRGLLAGTLSSLDELADDDFRRTVPRFQGDNLDANLALAQVVFDVAAARGCTPGQVALAWLQAQGDDVVAIPGTKRRKYLEENVAAIEITLDAAELARLDTLRPVGHRAADMGWIARSTPSK